MKQHSIYWTTHNGVPRLCLEDGSLLGGVQSIMLSAEADSFTTAKATFHLAGHVAPSSLEQPEQTSIDFYLESQDPSI